MGALNEHQVRLLKDWIPTLACGLIAWLAFVLLGDTPLVRASGLALVITWLLVSRLFGISSLAAICAALLAPLYIWLIIPLPAYLAAISIMSILLIWRHRSNIRKIIKGEEPRIGRKSTGNG